jgi:hypothetical protein
MNQSRVARMIDLGAVRSDVTAADVKSMLEMLSTWRSV